MSRRRYISTEISFDTKVNKLALEHSDFAVLFYTWMIPHAGDDGIVRGDPEELLLLVAPGRRDKTSEDVESSLRAMHELGLVEWLPDENAVVFPHSTFYKYQTYIRADHRRTPPNGDNSGERRKTPKNAASFKPSPSPSLTESAVETTSITSGAAREGNTAAAVCEHLAIPMESEPGELVTEAVEHYTDLPHLLEAKKCRTHYGSSWGKWTVAHRAQQFAKWLEKTDLFRRTDAEKYGKGRDSPPDTPVTPETAEDKAWVDRFYAGHQEAANRRRVEQRT